MAPHLEGAFLKGNSTKERILAVISATERRKRVNSQTVKQHDILLGPLEGFTRVVLSPKATESFS